jgi:ParB/RepB/Spo0J family partition protein
MSRSASPKRSRSVALQEQPALGVGEAADTGSLQQISIDRIDLPRNPARRFLGDIAALAESMQEYGLQQPITVRQDGDRYILTSGMRRLAGARMLRWKDITAFVRTVSADHAYLLDLIENLQREDLSPEEEADAFGELIRTRRWTVQQVADAVKRSIGYVSKRVRVFEDPGLREAIASQGLPVSTAEELLASEPEVRDGLIQRALTERWDQVQARNALRPPETLDEWLAEDDEPLLDGEDEPAGVPVRERSVGPSIGRPKGFTRAVREFHHLVAAVRPEHLTPTDRAALRALFRDLVMLARARTTPAPRVFPALPAMPERSTRATGAAGVGGDRRKATRA